MRPTRGTAEIHGNRSLCESPGPSAARAGVADANRTGTAMARSAGMLARFRLGTLLRVDIRSKRLVRDIPASKSQGRELQREYFLPLVLVLRKRGAETHAVLVVFVGEAADLDGELATHDLGVHAGEHRAAAPDVRPHRCERVATVRRDVLQKRSEAGAAIRHELRSPPVK